MFITLFARSICLLGVLAVLSACVAQQDLILPNKVQRLEMVSKYKQCVSNATNAASKRRFSEQRTPEDIVRASMNQCRGAKYIMLKDYPKGWRESLAIRVDEELFKQEVSWIQGAR